MTDTERLDWLEHNERAVEFTGEQPWSWRVRLGYTPRGGYDYAWGPTVREALDAAQLRDADLRKVRG